MKDDSIYEYQKEVHDYEVDFLGNMKTSEIQRVAQEAGSRQLSLWGFPVEKLEEIGIAYVLNWISIYVNRPIKTAEKLAILTTPRELTGVRQGRDLLFLSADKQETLVEISTVWSVIDFKKHTIIDPRAEGFPIHMPQNDAFLLTVPLAKKLKIDKKAPEIGRRKIRYSDLDYLNHLTNSRYADIFFDFVPLDMSAHTLTELHINFRREVCIDEEIALHGFVETQEDGRTFAYMHGVVNDIVAFTINAYFIN